MVHTHIIHLYMYLIAELKSQYKKEFERLQQARDNYDHEVRLYAEVEITVRHQTVSDHLACLSEQISLC